MTNHPTKKSGNDRILFFIDVPRFYDYVQPIKGFYQGVLPMVIRCLLQGIDESDEILTHLKNDEELKYLFGFCSCHGERFDCPDCQDQVFIEAKVLEFIEYFLHVWDIDPILEKTLIELDARCEKRQMRTYPIDFNRLVIEYVIYNV